MPVERIDACDDPRLVDYRDLPDGTLRRRRDIFVAESQLVVRTLLETGRFLVRSVLLTEAAYGDLRALLLAAAGAAPVFVTSAATIRSVVGFKFHRGCLAVGERGPGLPLEAVLAVPASGPRCLVVCEGLSNPDNIGGVFRNAAAFGAAGVVVGPGCADPLYRRAIRVSMGGSLRTPFAAATVWPADLARVRAAGFTIVALTPDPRARAIATVVPPARVAILVGAEGQGLSPDVRAAADLEVRIPMAPGVDSLNAATACAVALHRFAPLPGAGHGPDRC